MKLAIRTLFNEHTNVNVVVNNTNSCGAVERESVEGDIVEREGGAVGRDGGVVEGSFRGKRDLLIRWMHYCMWFSNPVCFSLASGSQYSSGIILWSLRKSWNLLAKCCSVCQHTL